MTAKIIQLDAGKLFYSGKALMEYLRLLPESEVSYTDGCRSLMVEWLSGIKFTPKVILRYYSQYNNYIPEDYQYSDWIDSELIEFCPWHNIDAIYKIKGNRVLKEYDSQDISKILSKLSDNTITYPFLQVSPYLVVYIDKGILRSSRSKGGKRRFREDITRQVEKIREVLPKPYKRNVSMKIDMFLENDNEHADVDRFSTQVMDAFNGIVYEDDKQIKDLRPRVTNVSNAYDVLECRTDPMGLFGMENIATGVLFPLATGVKNYFVVRILLN